MAQKKYRDKRDKGDDAEQYEFPMPEFDEKAFMRREMDSAKTTLWTALIAIVTGLLAWIIDVYTGPWYYGGIIVVAVGALLPRLFAAIGYDEEQTKPKAMIGNWFLLVFTSLAVWVIALNL